MSLINEIQSYAKKQVTEARYNHILACADQAKILANLYKLDEDKAYLAGLLHDIERDAEADRLLSLALDSGYIIKEFEKANPVFLHGPAAVTIAKQKWNITDKEVLDAIRHHNLGSIELARLGYILFIADFIEPNRKFVKDEFRNLIYSNDLESMLLLVLDEILAYNRKMGQEIYPPTIALYNYLKGAEIEKAK